MTYLINKSGQVPKFKAATRVSSLNFFRKEKRYLLGSPPRPHKHEAKNNERAPPSPSLNPTSQELTTKSKFNEATIPPVNNPTFACKSGENRSEECSTGTQEGGFMGNIRTEGGLYLPKVTLLLGVEWKPNSGHVTPGPVLFPQCPSVATAPRYLGALGAGGTICPRERHS